ncbi:hypothetical protein SUGI_0020700 [Cryptomeria japonica]|nr:hypothetical protein SUGI_0020700 [Cryptomeria japonica]
MAVSNNITGALNFVAMVLSVPIIGTGIWLATREDAECVRVLRWPLIVVGTILLLISFAGFVGAFWRVQYLLVIYLIFMLLFIVLLLAFVIFAFIVTNKGGGHSVPGRNYKEYQISDFSGWLRNYVEKSSHWNRIERCLSSSDVCRKLNQRYLSAQDFFNAHLTPAGVRMLQTSNILWLHFCESNILVLSETPRQRTYLGDTRNVLPHEACRQGSCDYVRIALLASTRFRITNISQHVEFRPQMPWKVKVSIHPSIC